MRKSILSNSLSFFMLAISLMISPSLASAADLSDYTRADYAQESDNSDGPPAYATLLRELPWDNPNVIDPAGDTPDATQDITAVYIDQDEENMYFRINLSETGDSAEPFTRTIYILLDGKIGGKKRVAKNVHADIPWDLLIKLKNPDDMAMYDIHELVTTDIMNFSSNPAARVIGFYIEKRFIESVVSMEDIRSQAFTEDKKTELMSDGTAVFFMKNTSARIPDISRMLETVVTTENEPEEEPTDAKPATTIKKASQPPIQNRTLQYVTTKVWVVPPWLLFLAGIMLVIFVCVSIILSALRKKNKHKTRITIPDRRKIMKIKDVKRKPLRLVKRRTSHAAKKRSRHPPMRSGQKKKGKKTRR